MSKLNKRAMPSFSKKTKAKKYIKRYVTDKVAYEKRMKDYPHAPLMTTLSAQNLFTTIQYVEVRKNKPRTKVLD